MQISKKRPEGERFLRGEGPRRIRTFAGYPKRPVYEGAAGDYWVHFALSSVARLRLVSWLCVHGPARGPALARALCLPGTTVHGSLNGMKDCGLVACAPSAIATGFSRSKTGGVYALDWSVTEDGRKYLWRFGWVTGRLVLDSWRDATFYGRTDVDPCDALRDCCQPSLLRSAWLALAFEVMHCGPASYVEMHRLLGLSRNQTWERMQTWRMLGWLDPAAARYDPYDYFRPVPKHQPPRYTFSAVGREAVHRHVHALRWAAQHSGYEAPDDDRFLRNEDGVGWLTVE